MQSGLTFEEIEQEIDKMNLEELLFVRMAPQTFINKKFENKLKESEKLIREIESNKDNLKKNEETIKIQQNQILTQCTQLKMEIEQSKDRINKLMQQKMQLNKQPTKEEFINLLDNEMRKKFKTPDNYFKEFLTKKISEDEFIDKLKELGTGKNYYYYKILSDKLKEM